MIRRMVAALLVLALLCAVFCGCKKKSRSENTFTFPLSAEPLCLDPQIAQDYASLTVIYQIMEGLTTLDANGNIQPGLAKDWEISEDGTKLTFHLREDAVWHVPDKMQKQMPTDFRAGITAEDFVFAIKRALAPDTRAPGKQDLLAIRGAGALAQGESGTELGVKALDAYTLVFELTAPDPDFLRLTASPVFMPCSEAFFRYTAGRYGLEANKILSAGPLVLSAWEHNTFLSLVKNPDYTTRSIVAESLLLPIIKEEAERLSGLREGTYDAAGLPDESDASEYAKSGLLTLSYRDATWSLVLNHENSLFQNIHMRQAFLSCVEPDSLAQAGGFTLAEGLIPPTSRIGESYYRDLASACTSIAQRETEESSKEHLNQGLQELGMKLSALEKPTLLCPDTTQAKLLTGLMLQSWQKKFGLFINLEPLSFEELRERVRAGNYDMAYYPVTASNETAVSFMKMFESGASENIVRFQSPELDERIQRLQTAQVVSEKVEALQDAEQYLLDQGLVFPIHYKDSFFAVSQKTRGVVVRPFTGLVDFTQASRIKS